MLLLLQSISSDPLLILLDFPANRGDQDRDDSTDDGAEDRLAEEQLADHSAKQGANPYDKEGDCLHDEGEHDAQHSQDDEQCSDDDEGPLQFR